MKPIAVLGLAVVLSTSAGANDRKPLEIKVVDDRISIHAEAVPLGWFLVLLDRVAGTKSTVPAVLANRNVSAQFTGLPLDKAVKKIFEGLALDYLVLEDTRIVVTAVSQVLTGPAQDVEPLASSANASQRFVRRGASLPSLPEKNPFQAEVNPSLGNNWNGENAPLQPAIIQTPFGPIVNPRVNQKPQQPGMPNVFGNTSPTILDLNKPTTTNFPSGP